jgi:hypothetical protein
MIRVFGVANDFTDRESLLAYLLEVGDFSIFRQEVTGCYFQINRHFCEMIICVSLTLLLAKLKYLFAARVSGTIEQMTLGNLFIFIDSFVKFFSRIIFS